MSDTTEFCYWCGKPSTSREHVPPKCLFPKKKDMKNTYNKDYRVNLITVPSCDEHNTSKSDDDEYLMACIAPYFGNNGVAYIHTQTKLRRAFKRNKKLFNIKDEKIVKLENRQFPIIMVEIDNYRLLHSFEAIARGLYYHKYRKRFKGKFKIIPGFIKDKEKNTKWNNYSRFCIGVIKTEQKDWTTKVEGENPDIFTYQFGEEDEVGCQMLIITFYRTLEVYISLITPKALKILN